MKNPRVVFDTNVLVSALVFDGHLSHWLRRAWLQQCTALGSSQTIAELQAVLRYRKFKLAEAEVIDLLGDYLPHVELVEVRGQTKLICRDPKDQKFLDLAHTAKADFLVTGDDDLLALGAKAAFRIIRPAEFLAEAG
ncbi:MAG: putative toxin-antitoxin system toxin component, PIN family [Panacagrimonas sp.]